MVANVFLGAAPPLSMSQPGTGQDAQDTQDYSAKRPALQFIL